MSIIFIMDRDGSLDLLGLDLPGEKITVIHFDDSLDVFRKTDPELALLDCGSQADRGVRMLEQVKKLRYDLPVILLADESSEELVIRALKAGVRDYFKKPVRPEELKATVLSILSLKRQTPEKRLSLQLARNPDEDSALPNLEHLPSSILRAVSLIEANISAPLLLEDLARKACLSKFHFCRLFKSHVGMSAKQFILRLRINHALTLLKNPDLTITTVALRAGFNELGEFTRQFRKATGHTPFAFRSSLRKKRPPIHT